MRTSLRVAFTLFIIGLTISSPSQSQVLLDTQTDGMSRVVSFDDGSFVTLWQRDQSFEGWQLMSRAVTDSTPGTPFAIGVPITIPGFAAAAGPDEILVVWQDGAGRLRGQILDSKGEPVELEFTIDSPSQPLRSVAVDGHDTGFTVAWTNFFGSVFARHFDLGGDPTSERVLVFEGAVGQSSENLADRAEIATQGSTSLVAFTSSRRSIDAFESFLITRPILADGLLGASTTQLRGTTPIRHPEIAALPEGGFVLTWSRQGAEPEGGIWVQKLDPDGTTASPAQRIAATANGDDLRFPRAAVSNAGPVLVTWEDHTGTFAAGSFPKVIGRFLDAALAPLGEIFPVEPSRNSSETGADAAFTATNEATITYFADAPQPQFTVPLPEVETGLLARPVRTACQSNVHQACLMDGRFSVRIEIEGEESPGAATAQPLTQNTAGFWFFSADNLEVLVKVLDGRPVNDHYWVLFGSISNLPYSVVVENTATGQVRRFSNPAGTLASQAITNAFPDDGSALDSPRPQLDVPDGNCSDEPTAALCLTDTRFRATAEWMDPRSGRTGIATGRLISENSGAFWFFGPENLEIILKVLDGRSSNGHFWTFVGSLTDVEVLLRVEDMVTGGNWTYRKPPFVLESHADTEALPAPGQN
ncbi:MAG: hypothetical protein AAF604_05200 [Acidobacteriota bacterium]